MRISFLVLLLLLITASVQAQPGAEKSQLEKERQEIQKELKEIQTLYESVKGQTKKNA
jgi:outer membrane lipoprotein-sorting protein